MDFLGKWYDQAQLLPWWQRTEDIRGIRLHLAGLDSAFMAHGEQDRNHLLIGRYQINQTVLAPVTGWKPRRAGSRPTKLMPCWKRWHRVWKPVTKAPCPTVTVICATACPSWITKARWKKGLPIGSGEIECAHRYVIQERLKLPGAWWTATNVEAMLALRINRANGEYDGYWRGIEKQAA